LKPQIKKNRAENFINPWKIKKLRSDKKNLEKSPKLPRGKPATQIMRSPKSSAGVSDDSSIDMLMSAHPDHLKMTSKLFYCILGLDRYTLIPS
jgi:hypothetical protein